MMYKITKQVVESLVPGEWYIEPKPDWYTTHISESRFNALGEQTLFIAMDQQTWLKGTGNTGIYGQWDNTHEVIGKYPHLINGVIAQYPILDLPKNIPQYIVKDSFDFINQHAAYIRDKLTSQVISITGTVGKTSTKEYLKFLLAQVGSVYATNKNHNSRTGVKLTLSNAMHNPDYIVIETAMAALWMKSGSISRLAQPHIAVITEIGVGQKGYDDIQTAAFKSKVAEGIQPNGLIILNRDIKEYEILKSYCEQYSQNIFCYGEHVDSDAKLSYNNEILSLNIQNQHYEFTVPFTDLGTIHNIAAALSVCHALNIDLNLFKESFQNLPKKASVLQEIPSHQDVLIIDDTYNAEHLSMLNAFKYCQKKYPQQRKLLVVGDIINLGDQSRYVHESLLQPILDADFAGVVTFGQDTQYLQQLLPQDKCLGHFTDAHQCAVALAAITQAKDIILVKGSRRNSTIHTIPQRLDEMLRQDHLPQSQSDNQFIYRADRIATDANILRQTTTYGLGGLLLVYSALKHYELKKIELAASYSVSANVAREGKNTNAIGLQQGEQYNFLELITQVILTQKPDSILALAELLYGTTNQALSAIKQHAQALNIDPKTILNVTGRRVKDKTQTKTIEDLLSIARAIAGLSHRTLSIANQSFYSFKGQIYQTDLLYKYKNPNVLHLYCGHADDRIDVVITLNQPEKIVLAKTTQHREDLNYTLPACLVDADIDLPIDTISLDSGKINILGDTYFGEFYTRIRKKRGVNDALQQYGYSHSFEKIAPFFQPDHLNIVNFEATFFAPHTDSPLREIKPYILDAEAAPTVAELKNRNIHHVVLANNHAKDYGAAGLAYTLEQLKQNQISYIGAAQNQQQAQKIFEVHSQGQEVAIFNGYWHRNPAYLEFDFYALGETNGVNSLNNLIDNIQRYKQAKPHSKAVVIAHWGVDFKAVHTAQRRMARRLVAAGTDLIIGHGPHCIQPIEYINKVPVIYSIGNGVFNSNGEFERYQVLPFGALVRLDLQTQSVDLYPLSIDNKKNFWQPTAVTQQDQIEKFAQLLAYQGRVYSFNQNEEGHYFTRISF